MLQQNKQVAADLTWSGPVIVVAGAIVIIIAIIIAKRGRNCKLGGTIKCHILQCQAYCITIIFDLFILQHEVIPQGVEGHTHTQILLAAHDQSKYI